MNEEEKKAIERMKRDYELAKSEDAIDIDIFTEDIKTVLNLLEKKDIEIEDWKMEYNHWCQLAIDRKKEIEFQKDINKTEKDRHKKTEKSLKGQIIKQNKIIDLMAKKLNQAYFEGDNFETWFDKIMGVQEKMDYGYVVPLIKQYFERKVEQ